jgi:hypothetical protein
MSNEREVFTILEDADGAGVALKKKAEGDAAAGANLVPAAVGKKAGNFVLLPVSTEGSDIGDAMPGLVAKDAAGDLKYLKVNADGEVLVSAEQEGTEIADEASVLGVLATQTEVVALTLAASEDYQDVEVLASCTQPCLWEIIQTNDETDTRKASFLTGPGQFSFSKLFKHIKFSAGASGTQELKLMGTQLSGKASDMNGYMAVIQKA